MPQRSTTNLSESTFSDLKLSVDKKTRLQKLVVKIVDEHNPQLIYLFGSHARNEARRNSVFDLLIIGNTELKFLHRIKAILKLSRNVMIVSPLYYTPQEWEILKTNNDGFMATVLEEAKLLYKKI